MKSCFLVLLALAICGIASAQKSPEAEQVHFSAEDNAVQHAVEIPESVLAILRTDELVREVQESENVSAGKLPRSWFSAARVHLSSGSNADLVVAAEGPLGGANVQTFWIFRGSGSSYELVLRAPVHDLIIKNTRHNGYRDIELSSESAVVLSTTLCRFDGTRYVKYRSKSEAIR